MIKDSLVAVDTETFYTSDFSLKKMSVFQYVNSPQFDCYMVSAYSPSYGFVGRPTEFDWDQLSGKDLLMHNAMFDTCVIRRMQEQGLVPKTFKFGRIFDTADAVAYQRSLRALDVAAKVFLNRTVDKGVRHLMRGKTWADVEGTPLGDDLIRYARTDPEVTYALWEKVGPLWPEPERRVSELSREAGIRGIYVDRPRLEAGIDTLQQQLFEAGRAIPWEWEPDKTPLSPGVMREQCRIEGIPCPASFAIGDEACDQWFEDYAEKYPWIKATRDWRRINMLLQKLLNMRQGLLPDDRFQYSLKYFGAATGRWSGSERFNLQNLPRGEMFGVDLRSLLVADPGEEFLIIDYAAIEARVLLWMVGDQGMLDLIRKGTNLYQAHAERTMGWDPARGDMKALGKTDAAVKKLYLLAKMRILGLGYGCSWKKFRTIARKAGIELTDEESQRTVQEYREANPQIVNFWRKRQEGLAYAVCHNDPVYEARLPSGRVLSYFEPVGETHEQTSANGDKWQRTEYLARFLQGDIAKRRVYGGLLTENIIQAIARDILVDGWLKLVDAGFKVKFTCHDEFVISAPNAKDALPAAMEIVQRPPDWAPGLPLAAEGSISRCYEK